VKCTKEDIDMGDKTIDYLWVMNEALIKGLKSAIFALEKVAEFSPENASP